MYWKKRIKFYIFSVTNCIYLPQTGTIGSGVSIYSPFYLYVFFLSPLLFSRRARFASIEIIYPKASVKLSGKCKKKENEFKYAYSKSKAESSFRKQAKAIMFFRAKNDFTAIFRYRFEFRENAIPIFMSIFVDEVATSHSLNVNKIDRLGSKTHASNV